jgi:hypothetical protein
MRILFRSFLLTARVLLSACGLSFGVSPTSVGQVPTSLNPTNTDPRPTVREAVPQLGDLLNDFDFSQAPRANLVLATNPPPGPASIP